MSYAIGHVVFGIAYDHHDHGEKLKQLAETNEELTEYDLEDIESLGFKTTYSGSAMWPIGWVGKCYDTIDECSDFEVDSWYESLNSKREQFQKDFQECFDSLPDFMKEMLKDEEPKLWVVWGSS